MVVGMALRQAFVPAAVVALGAMAYGALAGIQVEAAPGVAGCPVFPANNVWNTDISSLPVHPSSAAWLANMGGASRLLHPDFGPSGGVPYGIPFNVVDSSHPKINLTFTYSAESDHVPYPFGADTSIEGGSGAGGDRHAIMIDQGTCILYELYNASYNGAGGSTAGSGATWNLGANALRPAGWTSADAAGLPIFPGLLRLEEVQAGRVQHAIRFTAQQTDRSFIWPARHQAGAASNSSLPPMGARFRLRAGYSISPFSAATQVVLTAMQRYGLILADNGSNWYFQGAAQGGWSDTMISELKTIPAGQFDAVDESSLMVGPNSAQARQPGGATGPPPAVNRAPVVAAAPPPPAPPPPAPVTPALAALVPGSTVATTGDAATSPLGDLPRRRTAVGAEALATIPIPPVQLRGLRLPAVVVAAAELLALGLVAWWLRRHVGAG
jgi:hypothetical protein